jgi:methyltransferase-like protein
MLASNFAPEVQDTVMRIAPDVIRQEQYMDFLRNRTFRQTLLVRDGLSVDRSVTPQRVRALWASGALRPAGAAPDLRALVRHDAISPRRSGPCRRRTRRTCRARLP